MLAGHDTTSTTLTYALWSLGHHRDIQAQVRAEVAALGERTLTPDDVAELGLTVRVLHEALSLNPWMGDFAWSSYAVALKCGWVWRGGADVIRWPVPAFPCCDVPWVGPGMAGWTGAGWWGQAARGWMVG